VLLAPPFPRKASGSFDAVNFRAVMREPWHKRYHKYLKENSLIKSIFEPDILPPPESKRQNKAKTESEPNE
jgi:hypothetical protein